SDQGEALAPWLAEEQEDKEPKSPSTEEEGDDHCVAIRKAPVPTSRSQQSIATPTLSRYQSAEAWEECDKGCVALKEATGASSQSEQGEALAPRPDEEQEDEEPKSPSTEEEGDDHCVAIRKAPAPMSRSQQSIATPTLSRRQVVSPPPEYQEATALVAITVSS
ncbi:hypothetical protein Taro_044553, partial [Colocasia esculenta]|nr:hypothetical protein [Colocasia esculenta]